MMLYYADSIKYLKSYKKVLKEKSEDETLEMDLKVRCKLIITIIMIVLSKCIYIRYNLQSVNEQQIEQDDANEDNVDAEGFNIEESGKDKDKKSLSRRRVFKK